MKKVVCFFGEEDIRSLQLTRVSILTLFSMSGLDSEDSTNRSCSLSLDGLIDFVEHTVCRVSEVSVADAQRLSLTRHGWGAQDEVDRRIQGRRFDTLCHTFAETAPTFLLSRTFIPNNSLALIAFSQGGMIAFASAHNPNWPGFSKSSEFSILEWISSRSFR